MIKKITLCGSTKFKKEFELVNAMLSLEGYVVYSCAIFGHQSNIELTPKEKKMLDKVHKGKIMNSDEIYVINVDGYIGESTKKEIAFAKFMDKKVTYFLNENEKYNNFVDNRMKGVIL